MSEADTNDQFKDDPFYSKKDFDEKKNWETWLPANYGYRLHSIRDRVTERYQKAKRRKHIKWYTPHDETHCNAVERNIHQLIPGQYFKLLNVHERFMLLAGAWLHDIGMIRRDEEEFSNLQSDDDIRKDHHKRSALSIANNYEDFGIRESEADAFGLLAHYHRRKNPLSECQEIYKIPDSYPLRLRLLAAYLRLADALDVDQLRANQEQYAIMLTYNIPQYHKTHWLRSKYVQSIYIDAQKHTVTVHFKSPIDIENWEGNPSPKTILKKLDKVYEHIIIDLEEELDSVRDTLFRGDITYFIDVQSTINKVYFSKQLRNDTINVLDFYSFMDNPSSSRITKLVLDSFNNILSNYNLDSPIKEDKQKYKSQDDPDSDNIQGRAFDYKNQKMAKKEIISKIKEIEDNVLETRLNHFALTNIIEKASEYVRDYETLDKLKWFINKKLECIDDDRKYLRRSACRYFNTLEFDIYDSKKSINILLYGYSELVIESLCGFCDALAHKIMSKLIGEDCADSIPKCKNAYKIAQTDIKSLASKKLQIFICEGQPKNSHTWYGGIRYYDAKEFATALLERGFKNLKIIPDATATTLGYCHGDECIDKYPQFDFIMFGANGFNNELFFHSAGHWMLIAGSLLTKLENKLNNENKKRPKIILSVFSNKFKDTKQSSPKQEERNKCETNSNDSKKDGIIHFGDWPFYFYGDESNTRKKIFFPQNRDMEDFIKPTREDNLISFYNPRYDYIPIKYVDVVITERNFDQQDEQNPDKWTGKNIYNLECAEERPCQEE